jgi:hypothetical protein
VFGSDNYNDNDNNNDNSITFDKSVGPFQIYHSCHALSAPGADDLYLAAARKMFSQCFGWTDSPHCGQSYGGMVL